MNHHPSLNTSFRNDIIGGVVHDSYVVVERYSDYYEAFLYHKNLEDWSTLVNFHENRCPTCLYLYVNIREILRHVDHEMPRFLGMIRALLDNGVDSSKIAGLINYHSIGVEEEHIASLTGELIKLHKIRYFELEATLRHSRPTCLPLLPQYGWGQPSTSRDTYLVDTPKKFLGLFGKPFKAERAGLLRELYLRNLEKESILSCLIGQEGLEETLLHLEPFFERKVIEPILRSALGSPDDAQSLSPHTYNPSYPGYPYDTGLYENCFMSIVSETHSSVTQRASFTKEFFVTEKTARTLVNRHPFVIFSTKGFLQKFKTELGYQTFDALIDESYDYETDLETKLYKIIDAAECLYEKRNEPLIKEIVDFNFSHLERVGKEEEEKIEKFIKTTSIK